jgi:hypothetical protein
MSAGEAACSPEKTPPAANVERAAAMPRKSHLDDVVMTVRQTVAHRLETREPMQEGYSEENE